MLVNSDDVALNWLKFSPEELYDIKTNFFKKLQNEYAILFSGRKDRYRFPGGPSTTNANQIVKISNNFDEEVAPFFD